MAPTAVASRSRSPLAESGDEKGRPEEAAMGADSGDGDPADRRSGTNVAPGIQSERKVYEEQPGEATAGVGHPGTGPGGPLVSGVSEASKGAATEDTGRPEDEQ